MLTTTERQKTKSAKAQAQTLASNPPGDRTTPRKQSGVTSQSSAIRHHEDLSDWSNAS